MEAAGDSDTCCHVVTSASDQSLVFNTSQKQTEDKYEVTSSLSEAAILVQTTTEPKLTLKITLTSPALREDEDLEEEYEEELETLENGEEREEVEEEREEVEEEVRQEEEEQGKENGQGMNTEIGRYFFLFLKLYTVHKINVL